VRVCRRCTHKIFKRKEKIIKEEGRKEKKRKEILYTNL